MSKVSKFLYVAAASLAVAACGGSDKKEAAPSATKATLEGNMPSSEVVLAMYDNNMMLVADTLKLEKNTFEFDFTIAEGNPEFIYVISGNDVVVPVLLEAGAEVKVAVDSLGNVNVEGSEASLKLMESQKEYYEVSDKLNSLASQLATASSSKASTIKKQMVNEYLAYHRTATKYVMENSHSLTVIPVLYRTLPVGAEIWPVFSQDTAPYLYKQIADSLSENYPSSRYVQALKMNAQSGFNQMELQKLIDQAEVSGILDIELPGLDGKNKKLSEVDSKVVLLYFWTAQQAKQNLFNVEILKPLYEKYHKRGFDIFQVSLDTDKVKWATTIMGQELPWTNVCDTRGAASPYVSMYNLYYQTEAGNVGVAVPAAFVIHNGELIDGQVVDEASFKKLLEQLL